MILSGYKAHGAPPAQNDNGTIAFTAPGGAMAFAPEISLPSFGKLLQPRPDALLDSNMVSLTRLTSAPQWYDNAELGIDQGPIVIMAENYRNQNVWRLFMQNAGDPARPATGRLCLAAFCGADRAGAIGSNTVTLTWAATSNRTYQVEYSTNLISWFTSPTGEVTATNTTASWTDTGPPGTLTVPFSDTARFYRVFQYGTP